MTMTGMCIVEVDEPGAAVPAGPAGIRAGCLPAHHDRLPHGLPHQLLRREPLRRRHRG